jgi:hypothetical protein
LLLGEFIGVIKAKVLADNDLQLATSEYSRNDNCTYNLPRFQEKFKNPSVHDNLKIRSSFTEHPKLNYKFLTPDFGGQFIPAKGGLGHWPFQFIYVENKISFT